MPKGIITRLVANQGFGFIKTEERADLFFHRSELQGVAFDSLREGQEVEFDLEQESDSSSAVRVRLAQPRDK